MTSNNILRFRHKIEAFKKAQELSPAAQREKSTGFILLVGSGPQIVEAGDDREVAIKKAISILEETDTLVFVSKLQSKIGPNYITKDQLVLTRKYY